MMDNRQNIKELLTIITTLLFAFNAMAQDSIKHNMLKLPNIHETYKSTRTHRVIQNEQRNPKFEITVNGFTNTQNPNRPFIVYEIGEMKAEEMKAAVLSKLSTMFKSPQDVINTIGNNIISIEGYTTHTFRDTGYLCDMLFNMTIEFKDGRIRYNYPTIKRLYIDSQAIGMLRIDQNKTFKTINESHNETTVANYFNSMVATLNEAIKTANDW